MICKDKNIIIKKPVSVPNFHSEYSGMLRWGSDPALLPLPFVGEGRGEGRPF